MPFIELKKAQCQEDDRITDYLEIIWRKIDAICLPSNSGENSNIQSNLKREIRKIRNYTLNLLSLWSVLSQCLPTVGRERAFVPPCMLLLLVQVNVWRESKLVGKRFASKHVLSFVRIRNVETAWTNQGAKIRSSLSLCTQISILDIQSNSVITSPMGVDILWRYNRVVWCYG
jgi:hypothetical protein